MADVRSDCALATAVGNELPSSMIERTTLILDEFHNYASQLTIAELAYRTQLPRSTVHRILSQLARMNWVEHTAVGYRLGSRALSFGGGIHREIRFAAASLLHELKMQTGMVVHLVVLDGSDSLYLDKVGGRFAMTLPSRVGGRHPAHATAGGKSILAWLDPNHVNRLYEDGLSCCTDRTITDLSTLHRELEHIRKGHGLAFERGESVRGVACVGVAVRSHDGPIAAISLCGDARTAQLEYVAPAVVEAAHEISRNLRPYPVGQGLRGWGQ
ncbi:DNA-binding IclR family transcriptional regulator [Rhodococcus sp. LBL1]|nr:DNA-binding IclR family transcriptional regulator [Rhodococcus sp. LBL1]MDH6682760.1 DNA-binding IclR family transcriptional regulator [Rhodococcus sp. LBL2]